MNQDSTPTYLIYDPTVASRRKVVSQKDEEANLKQKIADYQQVLNKNDKDVVAWTNLGEAQRRLGDPENALQSHKNALAHDQNLVPALLGLALAQAELGDFQAANEAINQALQKEANRAISYIYKAEILLLQKDEVGAEKALAEAKKIDPIYRDTIKNISEILAW